jgi:hypothetical protein
MLTYNTIYTIHGSYGDGQVKIVGTTKLIGKPLGIHTSLKLVSIRARVD